MKKKSFLFAVLFFALMAPQAFANEASTIPTNIKADRMEYSAEKQTVIFYDNVHVIRSDFNMWSKKLIVYLDKEEAKQEDDEGNLGGMKAGDISKLVAEGDVVMKSQDKESHSSKATYTIKTDVLVLEGPPNPWLKDKDNKISGQKIYHYMNDDRSEVHGGVSASFTTLDKTPTKDKK